MLMLMLLTSLVRGLALALAKLAIVVAIEAIEHSVRRRWMITGLSCAGITAALLHGIPCRLSFARTQLAIVISIEVISRLISELRTVAGSLAATITLALLERLLGEFSFARAKRSVTVFVKSLLNILLYLPELLGILLLELLCHFLEAFATFAREHLLELLPVRQVGRVIAHALDLFQSLVKLLGRWIQSVLSRDGQATRQEQRKHGN
jgi:hypothetical protein